MTTAKQAAVLIFLAYMYGSLFAPESEVYTHCGAILKGMSDRNLFRAGVALLALCAALPALADTQFRIRRMSRDDVPPGKGQCDIRLQVDNEVEVSVRRDMVMIHTIAGRDARDDGSECNAPLPDRNIEGFNFQVMDSRNEIRLVAEPSRRNDFTAIVHIRDSAGGEGRYHFRLSWVMGGRGGPTEERRGGGPGFSWNNTVDYRGQGHGSSTLNNSAEERLFDVSVNVDRGGRILVTFRGERGRPPLAFTGTVIASEAGRLKADVVSEDQRLHGPMYISVDDRRNVYSITLEATDGRDRLRVNWDRK
jgi:hypothetical protein